MRRGTYLLLATLAASCLSPAETLRVMTFNVRLPSPGDGDHIWEKRRDLLVETISKYAPDIMGTQELFKHQGDFIVEKLPAYTWFGVSRRGDATDEHMGVFYRKSAMKLEDSGNFWLSDDPSKPGSISWNMSLPRMVTWGVFRLNSGRRLLYLNTHFAHRGEDAEARLNSASVIRRWIEARPSPLPIVLTGDFNTGAGSPPHQLLSELLKDAWLDTAKRSGPEDTFHGFKGTPRPGRIDWIMHKTPWKVTQVLSIDDHAGPLYPSDHFPILAVFELK